jgi:tRNA threonylcarbamoyladenosine biosynthesis protein TsaE
VTGVHRLVHVGAAGALVAVPPWTAEVRDLVAAGVPAAEDWLRAAEDWAREHGLLDLRSAQPLPGTRPLADREHARPVPVLLEDASATRRLGARVAAGVRAGDLLVLSGPLGAGKTTFTQGLGEAIGARGRVSSPTFVLARAHRGPLPLVHVDAYRLREALGPGSDGSAGLDLDAALEDLDLDAALEDAVTVVEWGEGLVEHLADARLEVRLERPPGGGQAGEADVRTARVAPFGARWAVLA